MLALVLLQGLLQVTALQDRSELAAPAALRADRRGRQVSPAVYSCGHRGTERFINLVRVQLWRVLCCRYCAPGEPSLPRPRQRGGQLPVQASSHSTRGLSGHPSNISLN